MNNKLDNKGFKMGIDSIATILIVEDDNDILELETFHLVKEGFNVIGLSTCSKVEEIIDSKTIDIILMDRSLQKVEGSEFVAYLRDKGVTTPVIFISAKSEDKEIEEAFERGGDDYITKPFNIKELIFRVKAILKRTINIQYERIIARDIIMDMNTRKTYIEDEEISLTKLEFELLHFFIKNKNRVLERDYLLKYIWKDHLDTQKRTVNVTINRLRKKIDPNESKKYIVPIRGIGYKFEV